MLLQCLETCLLGSAVMGGFCTGRVVAGSLTKSFAVGSDGNEHVCVGWWVLIAVFLQIGDGTSSSYTGEVEVSNPLRFSNGIS